MNPSLDTKMSNSVWAMIVGLGAIWGSSFFFFAVALKDFQPLTVAVGRTLIGVIFLVAVYLVLRRAMPRGAIWKDYLVLGLLNNAIPFTLTAMAQQTIESGLASILNATTPIFSVIVARLVGHESWTAPRLIAVFLGFLGVAVLMGPTAWSQIGSAWGQLLVLGAALSYSLAGVFGRRFGQQPALDVAFGQVVGASIVLLPLALVFDRFWIVDPGWSALAALFGIGTLCTAAAYPLFFVILRRAGATNAMLVTLVNPVTAVLLGVTLLGEQPTWTMFAGMALIALSLLTIDGRLLRHVGAARG
ncbi:MAG: DMT family transporter [Alphaproteobacteria bacterium]|nr:DMT family transporter [Alphaproteobacteria bacterium]